MGILNFDLYLCEVKPGEKAQFTVDVKGNDRTFLFEAKDVEERDEWVKVIEENIKES